MKDKNDIFELEDKVLDTNKKNKKALVLAGGFPQIDLINKLKHRGFETILADYYSNPVAKEYADRFYRISTLDVDAIEQLAIDEHVDCVITVCTDQALLTMSKVSEDLGLPCYIDYQTAKNVTNKSYMKRVFSDNNIPSAKFFISGDYKELDLSDWKYPLIVKPVDCNSSKGVRRVDNTEELEKAFKEAISLSRTKTAIVEEYISGIELSIDVYVEDGHAIVLDTTTSEKLKNSNKFIIFRTWHPSTVSEIINDRIQTIAQQIADSFHIVNAPMLIQMLVDGENVYVIEFSARTGGGVKHFSIERRTGVDIVSAVIDLTTGAKPHIIIKEPSIKYMVDEYIYCAPGIYDHIEGFDELKSSGIIADYYLFRWKESIFDTIENCGDRIGGFTIQGNTFEELKEKHEMVNKTVKVVSSTGQDIMRHDLLEGFDMQ